MLSIIMAIGGLSGCGNKADADVAPDALSPFAIYRKEDGAIIKIGDEREPTANLIGPDEIMVVEFEEDNVERAQYYGNEEMWIDYTAEGAVCAIRIETTEWKIFNGLSPGMKLEDVKNNYPEEYIHKYDQTEDLWIAYDANGNFIAFSTEAPYILRFKSKGGKTIDQITIQDNSPRL